MNLLFDTHAFIWADTDITKLPDNLVKQLSQGSNRKILSTVVPWEMRIKASLNKLTLRSDLKQIVDEQVQRNHFEILPVTLKHVYELDALPHHHGDPFDRLLIAQARVENLILVSSDSKIRLYDVPILWSDT